MTNLVFAYMQAHGGDEREAVLLARSLRKFGGMYANHPLWIMVPNQGQISQTTIQRLTRLDVQVNRFDVPKVATSFPFGVKVYAAAAVEALTVDNTDILVWMDSDTIFSGEPSAFLLKENISLGYRPVMLKNISSSYDEPINTFWEIIYKNCNTPADHVFPMLTTVDEVRIRPQFNAGIMSVRPEKGLLQQWRDNFERIHLKPELTPYYDKHVLYRIFVHQAILSATILAVLKETEIEDLGRNINVPMFLESSVELAQAAVTLRYDEYQFFAQPDWYEKLILEKPVQRWLREQVE